MAMQNEHLYAHADPVTDILMSEFPDPMNLLAKILPNLQKVARRSYYKKKKCRIKSDQFPATSADACRIHVPCHCPEAGNLGTSCLPPCIFCVLPLRLPPAELLGPVMCAIWSSCSYALMCRVKVLKLRNLGASCVQPCFGLRP